MERGANCRFAIRKRKNIIERQRRHAENQTLRDVINVSSEKEVIALENAVRSHPKSRNKFYKMADVPLGEVVSDKQEYREFKGMGYKKPKPKARVK